MQPIPPHLEPSGRAQASGVEADASLLGLAPARAARRLRALSWGFEDARAGEHTHAMHPYPAKFVPDLPRSLIQLLSRRGELVLDPFSGGGTAAVEALIADRRFYGIDANPVGNIIARAKTTVPTKDDERALRDLEAALLALEPAGVASATPTWVPVIPNRSKWYDDDVFHALAVIRDRVVAIGERSARELALVAFIQAAARLSFQESETRYTSKPRAIDVIEVPRAVVSELRRVRRISQATDLSDACRPEFFDGDARDPAAFAVTPGSVGLVVTSPPYPNTYDYHLYHRFRLFWLGEDPSGLRRVEIGSHLKNQGIDDPIREYLSDMRAVLDNCLRVLAPGRYAVFVVGDGLFKGETFETARFVAEVARGVGFDHVATLDRPLPTNRRSVTKPGRRLAVEQMLVLRRPAGVRAALAGDPNYALFPYERDLQLRELEALGGSPDLAPDGEVHVVPVDDLDRAAFTHAIRLPDGEARPTFQRRVEAPTDSSRRKNSTYLSHGIHRYKGKFYPQLAKSLLNLAGLEPGRSLVLDPFGGSGTVALEAILNGLDAVSVDCNPVAVAIARAKVSLALADRRDLRACFERTRAELSGAPPGGSQRLTQFGDDTLEELERWFPGPVLAKLDWLLGSIRSGGGKVPPEVLEVLVSDLVREVSQQEPRDLRIRRRKQPISDAPVYELFLDRLATLEERLSRFGTEPDGRARQGSAAVIYGDAADPATFAGLDGRSIDAVVSSPPYAAALPYIDTDRLSLAAVFGYGSPGRRPLEQTMIGSREITERTRAASEAKLAQGADPALPESTRAFLAAFAQAVADDGDAGFRRRQTPAVLLRYFRAMGDVLANVAASMTRGASCWLVLGDSRSTIGGRRWTIPTVDEVASIGQHVGLELIDRIPVTVTREDRLHARHAITRNEILRLEARPRAQAQP